MIQSSVSALSVKAGYRRRVRYVRDLNGVAALSPVERERLNKVCERYAFRANDYYLSLINWEDPNDPIRRLIIPHESELDDWGKLDVSNEQAVTVSRGVQHKYTNTVLLLCNEICGAYCRYCFRKRLFMNGNDEASNDVQAGIDYIRRTPDVTNVLLSGGDPLLLSTRRLGHILESLREIPHVKIIRIGSKMPAFDPFRILNDLELQSALRRFSTRDRRVYLMAHFDHPRELTDEAVEGLDCFLQNGVICANQCPLIKGVNDDSTVLSELFRKLSWIGCPSYYLFQGRPTAGNAPYAVPIVRGWQIFNDAICRGSGLSKRARFAMSHATGKIEVVGVDEAHIYLRYHSSKNPSDCGRFMVFQRDDEAYWLDQLEPATALGVPNFQPETHEELLDTFE